MKKISRIAWTFFTITTVIIMAPQSYAMSYTVTVLNTGTRARAINNNGVVTGETNNFDPAGNVTKAFIFDGNYKDIGAPEGCQHSIGLGINDRNEVTGFGFGCENMDPIVESKAFLYNEKMNIITVPKPRAKGFSINNKGYIVLRANTSDSYLYNSKNLTYIELPTLGAYECRAESINENNQVTGSSTVFDGSLSHARAFLYAGSILDLGTLGGKTSYGTDINNKGKVVGWSETHILGVEYAFIYDKKMISLGSLTEGNSRATSINNNDEIVGFYFIEPLRSDLRYGRAFIYKNNQMYDLNKQIITNVDGIILQAAWDINDKGQIVAEGIIEGEFFGRSFILTPIDPKNKKNK